LMMRMLQGMPIPGSVGTPMALAAKPSTKCSRRISRQCVIQCEVEASLGGSAPALLGLWQSCKGRGVYLRDEAGGRGWWWRRRRGKFIDTT